MAVRTFVGWVAGTALVFGLVLHVLPLAIGGLVGLLVVMVAGPGSNPLAETYRDIREPLPAVDRKQDW
jgi:hypothetical protein